MSHSISSHSLLYNIPPVYDTIWNEGDQVVQSLIDKGCMKQFVADGVLMCSYRTIKVSQITGSNETAHIEKDCFFFQSMN